MSSTVVPVPNSSFCNIFYSLIGVQSSLSEAQSKLKDNSIMAFESAEDTACWVRERIRDLQDEMEKAKDQLEGVYEELQNRLQCLRNSCNGLQIRIEIAASKVNKTVITKADVEKEDLYYSLKKKILRKEPIYVSDGTAIVKETLLRKLGEGGSKRAYELNGGRALLLPNMSNDSMSAVSGRWARIVKEEVGISEQLDKLGLLTTSPKQVTISLSPDSHEGTIPAYLSESFENLGKTKGWFILDRKNPKSSTWDASQRLFKTQEERIKEENWDPVCASLVNDVTKVCLHGLPIEGDSLNIAVVKRPFGSTSPYEVRILGFDFSSKGSAYQDINFQRPIERPDPEEVAYDARKCFHSVLDTIFYAEFGKIYDKEDGQALRSLRGTLVDKYSRLVTQAICGIVPEMLLRTKK